MVVFHIFRVRLGIFEGFRVPNLCPNVAARYRHSSVAEYSGSLSQLGLGIFCLRLVYFLTCSEARLLLFHDGFNQSWVI